MANKKQILAKKMVDCRTGKKAALVTDVKVFSDLSCMYISFDCEEKTRSPMHAEYNKPLFEGDIVEVLLSLGDVSKYIEIEVNQNGAMYCAVVENKNREGGISINKLDKPPCDVTVTLSEGRWQTEIIICYSSLLLLGFQIHKAAINLLRQDFDDGKLNLYALYPTYSDSFHKTEALHEIQLFDAPVIKEKERKKGVSFHNIKI